MARSILFVLCTSLLLLPSLINSEQQDVISSLLDFLNKLGGSNSTRLLQELHWSNTTDPCTNWNGVTCFDRTATIKTVAVENLELSGTLDAGLLCKATSITQVYLDGNRLQGSIPDEISNCRELTHLVLYNNQFSGSLPPSMSQLVNLKKLDISANKLSGVLPPGLAHISGLKAFRAMQNSFTGTIPPFDFNNLDNFNVSGNDFSGPVPDLGPKFGQTSVLENPNLCGPPLAVACPPSAPDDQSNGNVEGGGKRRRQRPWTWVVMASGYFLLLLVLVYLAIKKLKPAKKKNEKISLPAKRSPDPAVDAAKQTPSMSDYMAPRSRSEYSMASMDTGGMAPATPLIVLRNPAGEKALRLEELLNSPAELVGKDQFGSVYKVKFGETNLAVKRMKDSNVLPEEFNRRMTVVDRATHPRVLPLVAFYCSKEERLVVYEYLPQGSLFDHLHGNKRGELVDWGSRLTVAAVVSEGLAYMHKQLAMGHGNLKSSSILFNNSMSPVISDYGLAVNTDDVVQTSPSSQGSASSLPADVHEFGVILLELLTGKPVVGNNGGDLAKWVNSVVREEWTAEVFDKSLVRDGGSEGRMVRLLQVALGCVSGSATDRPVMEQVAELIHEIREEEERSGADISINV